MAQQRKRRIATPESLLEGLNPEQRDVVLAGEGAYQVLAGAGAGKTKSLVHRIARLCLTGACAPNEILAVTFSKKAADEMNKRLKGLGITDAEVRTWHSLALLIAREEIHELNDWEIDTKDRFRIIVKDVLGWKNMKWNSADLGVVCSYIGLCKANLAKPGTLEADAVAKAMYDENPCAQTTPALLAQAYVEASSEQARRCLMTFDDMLIHAYDCLRKDEIRDYWAGKFRFVLQDEAQDENLAQATIAEQLAKSHGNYMIVGDPAQSIYRFRGAVPEKFMAFPDEWPGAQIIRMGRNYRSGRQVIEAANMITAAMSEGTTLGVDMSAERGTDGHVSVADYTDMDSEGEEVARQIQAAGEDTDIDWRDMAVLYRTNAQSRAVEEHLLSLRIPYVVLGGTNFYARREVKDLVAYLRVAEGRGKWEDVKRSINTPFRYLGRAFLDRLEADHSPDEDWTDTARRTAQQSGIQRRQISGVEEWCTLIERLRTAIEARAATPNDWESAAEREQIRHLFPASLLEDVIRDTRYTQHLTRDEGEESVSNSRVSNVRELVRSSGRFTTVPELLDYVDETLEASRRAGKDRDLNRVTLCSVHRAKGLEWRNVWVIGANEKLLPHGRARGDEGLQEERRLFYVAVTRAMDCLSVSHVSEAAFGNKVLDLEPSRFLAEAGLIDVVKAEELAS